MAELFVGLENNQKKLIPTSSEARSGNPLGSKIALQNNVVPIGYVKCDGQQFDSTQYPALYAYLGTDVAPCEFDHSRLGEFETLSSGSSYSDTMEYDGFLYLEQNTGALLSVSITRNGKTITLNNSIGAGGDNGFGLEVKKGDVVSITGLGSNSYVYGAFYKHYLCIKATSGLEETQQDYVLQSLLEADSYSTEEVATGKKWIDGKPIYRKVIQGTFANGTVLLNNVDMMTFCYGLTGGDMLPKESTSFFYKVRLNSTNHTIYIDASATVDYMITVEYTKTT